MVVLLWFLNHLRNDWNYLKNTFCCFYLSSIFQNFKRFLEHLLLHVASMVFKLPSIKLFMIIFLSCSCASWWREKTRREQSNDARDCHNEIILCIEKYQWIQIYAWRSRHFNQFNHLSNTKHTDWHPVCDGRFVYLGGVCCFVKVLLVCSAVCFSSIDFFVGIHAHKRHYKMKST